MIIPVARQMRGYRSQYVIGLISARRKKREERRKKIDKTGRKRMEGFVFFWCSVLFRKTNINLKEGTAMRKKLILLASFLVFVMVGCAPGGYFGVPNRAMGVPDEFGQTEAAIASAENSAGAKYCPEKIARAKALAKEGAETYWACRTAEGMALLAQARQLAKEAESCQPPPRAAAPPPPPPQPRVEEKVIILVAEPKVEEKVVALAAEPKPKVIILAFEDVHFDFDKSTLKPEAQTILKRNIQLLKDNPKAQIRIAGYTSASGTEAYNQRLSERRAKAVQEYLVNEGIVSRDRLSTIGYGETRPAEYEAAPKDLYSQAAKANMRVLFEIIVK
jgi:outer membrane protein OmpA-like peptidoglycan-associated protein